MRFNRKFSLCLIFIVVVASRLIAQTTPVPPEEKSRTAPFLFDTESAKAGEQIYQTNCKSCHGDPGKGNYAKLSPIPKDPTSAEYQKNSDGEMFFILSHGRGLMPNFTNVLSADQRWKVISFVRSLNKDYKQPPIKIAGEAVKTETAKMVLTYDKNKKLLFAAITDSTKSGKIPLSDITIKLFVKRTFGNLLVAESTTGKEGIAKFNLPNDIPGDSLGLLSLVAKTQGNSKELISSLDEKIGLVTIPKKILEQRAWWNINRMAPVWLILMYLLGISGIGVTVLFILLQLRKIKKINDLKR